MSDSLLIPLVVLGLALCTIAGLVALIVMGVMILERLNSLKSIAIRVENVEDYLRDLSSEVNNAQSASNTATPVFRSLNGKYTASSLEELIKKMTTDASSNGNPMKTEEDFRKFFDQIDGASYVEDEDDDDDDDTPKWK